MRVLEWFQNLEGGGGDQQKQITSPPQLMRLMHPLNDLGFFWALGKLWHPIKLGWGCISNVHSMDIDKDMGLNSDGISLVAGMFIHMKVRGAL